MPKRKSTNHSGVLLSSQPNANSIALSEGAGDSTRCRDFDQPDRPLALETFINHNSPEQRANYATLATQTSLPMLFYDDTLTHRLTKVIPYHQHQETAFILAKQIRSLRSQFHMTNPLSLPP